MPASEASLTAEANQRLEDVERKVLPPDNLAKVMEGSPSLADILDGDVVLSQKFVRFVIGHLMISFLV